MTITVGAYEAKTSLSRLLSLVEHGETVIVTRHGRPLAPLSPVEEPSSPVEDILAELAAISRRATSGPERAKGPRRHGAQQVTVVVDASATLSPCFRTTPPDRRSRLTFSTAQWLQPCGATRWPMGWSLQFVAAA